MDTAGVLDGIGAGVGRQNISDLLGGASIVCWLFAQLPQVAENYRNSSVEGLALPFLVSWLLGDVTNLIGCILTNQLPFQTYLATYFTIIDIILMLQYVHYTRVPHGKSASTLTSNLPSSAITAPLSASSDVASRKYRNGHRSRQTSTATVPSQLMSASWMTDNSQRRTLKRKHTQGEAPSRTAGLPPLEQSLESLPSFADSPQQMIESFHSEISRKTASSAEATVRGRPNIIRSNRPSYAERHSNSREAARQSEADRGPSQSSTRSVVFLSIFALVGIGKLTMPTEGLAGLSRRTPDTALEPIAWEIDLPAPMNSSPQVAPAVASMLEMPMPSSSAVPATPADKLLKPPQEPEPDYPFPHEIDIQRLIGRISAWICVVFYLTSRMPQIWKNFQRRSCEGLSILLFIAAFHGNLFYVISILSSPLVQTEEGFLVESTPFLIGSGGTLIFDLTILFQSCIYAGRAPKHPHHHQYHSHSSSHRRTRILPENDEEIAAFLAPEIEEDDEDDGPQRESRYRQRRRSGSPRPQISASRRRSSSRGKSKSSSAAVSKSWHGPPLPLVEPDAAHRSKSRSRSRPRTTGDDPPSTA